MNFASDNAFGAAPEILAALSQAASGTAAPYGEDAITAALEARFGEIFERPVAVFPVVSGTAANALSLATLVPPHGAIVCHAQSHVAVHECGAAGFFSHGARLIELGGAAGKLAPGTIETALAGIVTGDVHSSQPAAVTLTQSTELGTVYRPGEIAAIAAVARRHGMKLHMDGARFANALAGLGCAPADITWRAGIDVLSFGATKNGALGAEAVIFFDPALRADFEYRRKRAGHLLSKMRFVSAQLAAYLADGLWLKLASHANAQARRLGEGLAAAGAEIVHPVEANAVFVHLPDDAAARMRKAGAVFYDWQKPHDGRTLIRLVTSFATKAQDVDSLVRLAGT